MQATSEVHKCHVCQKSFERRDRLRRHFQSHQNHRSFKCYECGKAYNRRDLLTRHYTAHDLADTQGSEAPSRRPSRAHQACEFCAASKLKCDNEKPCKRCRQANRACTRKGYGPSSFADVDSAAWAPSFETPKPTVPTPADKRTHDGVRGHSAIEITTAELSTQQNQVVNAMPESGSSHSDMQNSDVTFGLRNLDDWSYPMYFEQIMMPQSFSMDSEVPIQAIPDVAGYMQDGDMWSDSFDIFDFEINMTSLPGNTETSSINPQQIPESPASVVSQDSLRARFDAFRRSPWLWTPSLRQHAFSDQSNIAIHNADIELTSPSQQLWEAEVVLHEKVDQASRDKILQLVIEVSQSKVSIPAFPSHEIIDTLTKTGIIKRARTDSWLHLGTFHCGQSRPELLTALLSAGCVCFGITEINRMGLLLQEIVRLSLNRLFETDNSMVRDLQYLQAYMLWIDIGITCGHTRKMEIAESHFQPLCTALRRAGAFDRTMYHDIVPSSEDDSATLDKKWHQWARQESFKRLAYHVFEYDMRIATMFQRNPLTSFAEFTAALPCSPDLWLASSAESWRVLFLGNSDMSKAFDVSLQDLIPRPGLLETSLTSLDITKAKSLLLNGLAGQVFEFRKNSKIAAAAREQCSARLKIWLKMRQEDLYQDLAKLCSTDERDPAIVLFQEFLLMSLYVDLDDVQRFAGKHGEREARRAYAFLESWFMDEHSRNAAWHAGQVLRSGRLVPQYQLRGFEAIALYQATLVLWVYGVLKCAFTTTGSSTSRTNGFLGPDLMSQLNMPARTSEGDKEVFLDGPANGDVKRFIELGQGAPGLRLQKGVNPTDLALDEQFCDLRKPHLVMAVGANVLESNYPTVPGNEAALPPLPHRLRDLMQILGALPGVQVV